MKILYQQKKRTSSKKSIKINCKAKCKATFRTNGTVFIEYNWKHTGHDPVDIEDISKSRIDNEIRAWVEQHVDHHLDWKGIKALLRLSDEEMDTVSHFYFSVQYLLISCKCFFVE